MVQMACHEDDLCRHSADEARCRAAGAGADRCDADDRLRREGYARQRGQLETYRGHEYKTNLLRKIALEIAVNDDFLDRTVDAWKTSPAPARKATSATARSLSCRWSRRSKSATVTAAKEPFERPHGRDSSVPAISWWFRSVEGGGQQSWQSRRWQVVSEAAAMVSRCRASRAA